MALTYKDYFLNENSVEEVSADLQAYLNKLNLERRNIQRLRLTVEALLLNIMEGCGKKIGLSVSIDRRFGRDARFRLEACGVKMVSDHLYTGCTIALQFFRIACEADRLGYLDRAVLDSSLSG